MSATRDWLLADAPTSRRQAGLGSAYRTWLALSRNPLAVVGGLIVLSLILVAAFAPWLRKNNSLQSDQSPKLEPKLA